MTTLDNCRLCGRPGGVASANFQQIYRQAGGNPEHLTWWECRFCRGWFVYPVPTPDVIVRNVAKAAYNDPAQAIEIAKGKEAIQRRILSQLSDWTMPGRLLDYGCNFGEFLTLAKRAGWDPFGFDPNETALETAREKGLDVRGGWLLEEAGFPEKHFAAITANDSFALRGILSKRFRPLSVYYSQMAFWRCG